MPIYAYRCETCGHAKDVLQKMSDPVLTTCPACGAETFRKQLTAAGFQLKGSGWYVTDFRGGDTGKKPAADAEGGVAKPAETSGDAGGKDAPAKDASTTDKPATVAPAPSAEGGEPKAAAPAPSAPAPSVPPAKP